MNRFIITFKSDWAKLFYKFNLNWYEFNLIQIYFEYDKMHEAYSLDLYLLGFGMTVRYNTKKSDAIYEKYQEMME